MTDQKIYILNEQLAHYLLSVHNVGAGGVDHKGSVIYSGLSLKRLMQVSRRQLKAMGDRL